MKTSSKTEDCEILQTRARALALKPIGPNTQALVDVIEFRLGSDLYNIEAKFVREICPFKDFTPIPGTPPFVVGLMNLRGEIFSVLDIRQHLDLPTHERAPTQQVIVIQSAEMEFGILADEVTGAIQIDFSLLSAPPKAFAQGVGKYLKGITKEQSAVLDAIKLLSDQTLIINQQSN